VPNHYTGAGQERGEGAAAWGKKNGSKEKGGSAFDNSCVTTSGLYALYRRALTPNVIAKGAHVVALVPPGAPGDPQVHLVVLFSKKRTCQVRLGISRCTHVIEGAPGLSIRCTWAKKKRACKSAHRAWVSSNHQPDPQAHMW
jgi:hypothetical protein